MSNVTHFVIFIYAFLFYFFFKYYLEKYNINVRKILVAYLVFVFSLALIYVVNAGSYFQIRNFWTMGGNEITVQSSLLIHRFTSTFSDPNNASVAIIAIFTFLLFNERLSLIKNLFIILVTAIIIFSTMSSTGMILLGLILTIFILKIVIKVPKSYGKIKVSTLYSLLFLIFLIPLFYYFISVFMGTEVAQYSLERYTMNSADSRFDIWRRLLVNENIFSYVLYGMGGTVFVSGAPYPPHNGHLHLIYNYGMIVYIIFMYIFFRIRINSAIRHYLFIIPFLVGFTMNVGIYEPRFANLLAFLVAVYASRNNVYLNTMKYK